MFGLFSRKKNIDTKPLKELTPEEFEKIKFKARIAFVDDEEISHIPRLQKDGYNITHFSDVENIDDFIRKKYHLVVLDIQGVGQEIAPESEGWGILKYLKNNCPNLVVIMFTGAEWSITKYKEEADIADNFIGKDLEFLDFKSKLDDGIKMAFSPSYHFKIAKDRLGREIANAETLEQIEALVRANGSSKKQTLNEVKKITSNVNVLETIETLTGITESISNML